MEARNALGMGLRVEFERRGDRFGHVILLVMPGEEAVPLLESVEGGPSEDWPPSPPLQSLSIETLPDGRRAALLVGMAGKSHWSASIEAATPGEAALVFDVACRAGSIGGQPLSTYRTKDGARLRRVADQRVEVSGRDSTSRLRIESGPLETFAIINEREFSIAAIAATSSKNTQRWKYRIELTTEIPSTEY
jgi:hypothetical protein